jgi:hypothetical protein
MSHSGEKSCEGLLNRDIALTSAGTLAGGGGMFLGQVIAFTARLVLVGIRSVLARAAHSVTRRRGR